MDAALIRLAKIALLIVSLLASKFSSAIIVEALSAKAVRLLTDNFKDDIPPAGYLIMSIFALFFGLALLFTEKTEDTIIFKYSIVDRIVGIAIVYLAFFMIYIKFFQ